MSCQNDSDVIIHLYDQITFCLYEKESIKTSPDKKNNVKRNTCEAYIAILKTSPAGNKRLGATFMLNEKKKSDKC